MAFFNEIGAGRYNRFIQKLFNMKGGPPARQLASDVMMVMPFFSGVEHRYLEGWQRYAFSFVIAAGGAGNFGVLQLTNPSTSNAVVVLEKIVFGNGTAALLRGQIGFQANGLADLANLQAMGNIGFDFRGQTTPIIRATFKNNTAVAPAGTTVYNSFIPVQASLDVILTENQELPLLPTSTYSFGGNVANVELDVFVAWRERALEDSEFK